MIPDIFHVIYCITTVLFFAIRVVFQRKIIRFSGVYEVKESKIAVLLRFIIGIPFMFSLLVFTVYPQFLSWATLEFPEYLRWFGAILTAASVPLLWWVHYHLDVNFSGFLHIRKEHTLVTTGPYHFVRHPMYSVLYLYMTGLLFLTQNWFIAGIMLGSLTAILINRLHNEESLMTERFGEQYRQYQSQTGKFLPRFNRLFLLLSGERRHV